MNIRTLFIQQDHLALDASGLQNRVDLSVSLQLIVLDEAWSTDAFCERLGDLLFRDGFHDDVTQRVAWPYRLEIDGDLWGMSPSSVSSRFSHDRFAADLCPGPAEVHNKRLFGLDRAAFGMFFQVNFTSPSDGGQDPLQWWGLPDGFNEKPFENLPVFSFVESDDQKASLAAIQGDIEKLVTQRHQLKSEMVGLREGKAVVNSTLELSHDQHKGCLARLLRRLDEIRLCIQCQIQKIDTAACQPGGSNGLLKQPNQDQERSAEIQQRIEHWRLMGADIDQQISEWQESADYRAKEELFQECRSVLEQSGGALPSSWRVENSRAGGLDEISDQTKRCSGRLPEVALKLEAVVRREEVEEKISDLRRFRKELDHYIQELNRQKFSADHSRRFPKTARDRRVAGNDSGSSNFQHGTSSEALKEELAALRSEENATLQALVKAEANYRGVRLDNAFNWEEQVAEHHHRVVRLDSKIRQLKKIENEALLQRETERLKAHWSSEVFQEAGRFAAELGCAEIRSLKYKIDDHDVLLETAEDGWIRFDEGSQRIQKMVKLAVAMAFCQFYGKRFCKLPLILNNPLDGISDLDRRAVMGCLSRFSIDQQQVILVNSEQQLENSFSEEFGGLQLPGSRVNVRQEMAPKSTDRFLTPSGLRSIDRLDVNRLFDFAAMDQYGVALNWFQDDGGRLGIAGEFAKSPAASCGVNRTNAFTEGDNDEHVSEAIQLGNRPDQSGPLDQQELTILAFPEGDVVDNSRDGAGDFDAADEGGVDSLREQPGVHVRAEKEPEDAQPETNETSGQRFYLRWDSPVEKAPTIGPKMAGRLLVANVLSVRDLILADPQRVADVLKDKGIKPKNIVQWQQQATLVCEVPGLRGHDAQLLVACGIVDSATLSLQSPVVLWKHIGPFAYSKPGQRLLRGSTAPDLEEVAQWVFLANSGQENRRSA